MKANLRIHFNFYNVAQWVKSPPATQKMWVRSLGQEDPLDEGMVTHSSIFAWRIPMDREAWRATVHRVAKGRTCLSTHTYCHYYSVKSLCIKKKV